MSSFCESFLKYSVFSPSNFSINTSSVENHQDFHSMKLLKNCPVKEFLFVSSQKKFDKLSGVASQQSVFLLNFENLESFEKDEILESDRTPFRFALAEGAVAAAISLFPFFLFIKSFHQYLLNEKSPTFSFSRATEKFRTGFSLASSQFL